MGYQSGKTEIKCPFCEKGKISVRHKPSIAIRKRTKTATFGSRYQFQRSKEIFDVLSDCPDCNKTKEEIEKRLKEGKVPDREALLKRIKEQGLPTKI